VESDRFLWADEQPFTDFGQHGEGKLDIRVFEQDLWWVDQTGAPHLLTEMSEEYLTNVLKHLYSNLEYFHAVSGLRFAIEQVLTVLPTPGAPANMEAYEEYVNGKTSPEDLAAAEWLYSTPLVKRLLQLLEGE
jgi:hypothetical protein